MKPLEPLTKLAPETAALYAAFPVRKTARQKRAFREGLLAALRAAGWNAEVQSSGLPASHNVIAGDPKTARLVLTAHYDTPARLPFPNFITPRNLPVFILYQILLMALITVPGIVAGAALWVSGAPFLAGWCALLVLMLVLCVLMLAGPANPHNANDNSSGVMTLLQIALTLPPELREAVALIFFDNEELGLLGSSEFRRKNGSLPQTLLLNFDCVGDGDTFLFVLPRDLRRDAAAATLQAAFEPGACLAQAGGVKQVFIDTSPFTTYPSDQMQFKRGVGVAAMRRAKVLGLYISRLHTARDTVLQEDNVLFLCAGAARLAAALAQPSASLLAIN